MHEGRQATASKDLNSQQQTDREVRKSLVYPEKKILSVKRRTIVAEIFQIPSCLFSACSLQRLSCPVDKKLPTSSIQHGSTGYFRTCVYRSKERTATHTRTSRLLGRSHISICANGALHKTVLPHFLLGMSGALLLVHIGSQLRLGQKENTRALQKGNLLRRYADF